jgi:hypothetical protein
MLPLHGCWGTALLLLIMLLLVMPPGVIAANANTALLRCYFTIAGDDSLILLGKVPKLQIHLVML